MKARGGAKTTQAAEYARENGTGLLIAVQRIAGHKHSRFFLGVKDEAGLGWCGHLDSEKGSAQGMRFEWNSYAQAGHTFHCLSHRFPPLRHANSHASRFR